MSSQPITQAVFRAILRSDGSFVAGIAALPGDRARFFICKKGESADAFVGRVARWVKAQGAEGVQMAPPDVLEEGTDVGELLMRLRSALGAPKNDSSPEFDVVDAKLELTEAARRKSS